MSIRSVTQGFKFAAKRLLIRPDVHKARTPVLMLLDTDMQQ
ncbi:hypothetical protein [Paenibacillus yonginensis]|nr:hypothetical protein [Paenibacillus yonginensis]